MALAMSGFIFPKTWNYKITIEIETPEGIKSGSAVRQVRARRELAGYINPSAGIVTYDVIGEAVVIDLGKWGLLFGLIEDTDYVLLRAAFGSGGGSSGDHRYFFANPPMGTVKPLSTYQPKLVMFEDINDPKSIQLVYINQEAVVSEQQKNNFFEIYKEQLGIKSMVVEITNDPVTLGIENWLPWIRNYKWRSGYLGGEQSPPFKDLSKTYVRYSNFKAEE